MTVQRKKLTREQAARKLYAILEQSIAALPAKEQARRWARLEARVAKYRRTRAKPSKRVQTPGSRAALRIR
jgi:hypothetical protein